MNLRTKKLAELVVDYSLRVKAKENGGGNDSAIHWDIVKSMRRAKIILDGRVIQENGVWQLKKSSKAVKI